MSDCARFQPLLQELVDGALDDVRARAVRGHLRACPACARTHGELEVMVRSLAGLLRDDPPSGLWKAIEVKLNDEDVALSRRASWWWWWQRQKSGLLAGAGALAVLVTVGALVLSRGRAERDADGERVAERPPRLPGAEPAGELLEETVAEVERAAQEHRRAVDDLRALASTERARWRPEVARAFDENLATIDLAVERQRALAHARPLDPEAQDLLHASYRRQIDFLQEAVLRGDVAP